MPNSLAPVELINKVFSVEMAETRFQETPILGLLANNARVQPRRDITWTANLNEPTTSGRTVAGPLSNDTQNTPKSASLVIPDYYHKHQFEVLSRDVDEAAAVGEIGAIRDILGFYVREALNVITRKINKSIINGLGALNGTDAGIYGLEYVATNANNYAGIDRTANPKWRCIVQTGATPGTPEALTVNRITEMKLARREAGASYQGNSGLVILTDPRIKERTLRNLYKLDANPQGGYNGVLNISDYTSFYVEGIPVLDDFDVQDNSMLFLDLNMHRLIGFDLRSPMNRADVHRYMNYKGLQFRLSEVEVGNHPDKYKFELVTNYQLQVIDPLEGISVLRDVNYTVA